MSKKQEILDAFHYRFACKEFDTTKKMSDEDFQFILETARLSPSSFGFEPWKLLVVENKELREALMPLSWGAQTQLPTADKFVILLARTKEALAPESEYIQNHLRNVAQMPDEVVAFTRITLKISWRMILTCSRTIDWFLSGLADKRIWRWRT